MNSLLLNLVESNSLIELAHLQVEGKSEGHGRITIDNHCILFNAITKAAAVIRPGEDLKVRATTLDGTILRITGFVLSLKTSQPGPSAPYVQLVAKIHRVRGRKSGKDPDED